MAIPTILILFAKLLILLKNINFQNIKDYIPTKNIDLKDITCFN